MKFSLGEFLIGCGVGCFGVLILLIFLGTGIWGAKPEQIENAIYACGDNGGLKHVDFIKQYGNENVTAYCENGNVVEVRNFRVDNPQSK